MSNEFVAKKGLISNGNATINGNLSTTNLSVEGDLNTSGDFNLGSGIMDATIYTDSNNLMLSAAGDIITLNNLTVSGNLNIDGDFDLGSGANTANIYTDVNNNLVLSGTGSIILCATNIYTGNLLPSVSGVYDLGSSTHAWRDLWLSGSSIHMGGATINAQGGTIVITNSSGQVKGFNKPTVTTLVDDASVYTDASLGDIFMITLSTNTELMNPTNYNNGQSITWYLKQNGTGGHVITLDSGFVIPRSATTPLAFSVSADYMDILAVKCDTVNQKFYVVSMIPGY